MPSAIPIVSFFNVALFPGEKYGISGVSFRLKSYRKYRIVTNSDDQANCILRLLEGRQQPSSGLIRKQENLFCQSDRLLMGERVITKKAEEHLGLKGWQFRFDNRRRSKHYFIDLLGAKHILFYPVYKLKGEDKMKFTLLSLLFQRSGLILISDIIYRKLEPRQDDLLVELTQKSQNTLCIFTRKGMKISNLKMENTLNSMETIKID